MPLTKHQKRLEKLSQIAKELEKVAESVRTEVSRDMNLTLKQKVGMSLSISEVQDALNTVRLWSTL